jgi:hypothetical protein
MDGLPPDLTQDARHHSRVDIATKPEILPLPLLGTKLEKAMMGRRATLECGCIAVY